MSDGLTRDAIEKIEEMALATRRVKFHNGEKGPEPNHIYLVETPDGKIERRATEAPLYDRNFHDPEELIRYLREGGGVIATIAEMAVVYVDPDDCGSLTCLLNFADPRVKATVPMKLSEPMAWLKNGKANGTHQTPALVRILRITFAGCLNACPEFLPLVRNIKWTSGAEAAADIQHGRESIGRSIQQTVRGESAIPEEIILGLPVWSNDTFRVSIRVAVEVLTAEQTFRLTPFPGEIENAMAAAYDYLIERFGHDNQLPPAFIGRVKVH